MATLEKQIADLKVKIQERDTEKIIQIKYLVGSFAGKLDLVREGKAKHLVKAGKAEIVKADK